MTFSFADFVSQARTRVDEALEFFLFTIQANEQPASGLSDLYTAMHYSLLNGGKRVRPILAYASAYAIDPITYQVHKHALDRIACALESLHAYSLIHDDLPAMDDDGLRRGKPTCHIAFNEATAILAGDALQTFAFELLSELNGFEPLAQISLVRQLAHASGARGMVLGQALDLGAVDQELNLAELETMHRYKTGALIRASVSMGATAVCASSTQLDALSTYAAAIGLAFQVQDDILDVITDTQTLGKQQGADIARNKPTYVALLGLDGARAKAQELHEQAIDALSSFNANANYLRNLSAYIIERNY